MTRFLVRRFVKDYQNISDRKVRSSYGTLSSVVGIACNILLFALKYVVGTFSHSISVISDAFNNLSDCGSCFVTLFGYKLAAKPADKDHPFGHGRMEYLTSLTLAVIILLMGLELLKNSVEKIIHPESVRLSLAVILSLAFSILVKLWMSSFNRRLGKMIDSPVMLATAQDSRNDVIATSAAAVGLLFSAGTSLPMDGIMGAVVSVMVLISGFEILRDTVGCLLGKPADREFVEKIKNIVCESERIIGVHDMIIHDYGPGNYIGSCHVEVRSDENLTEIHDIVDGIERRVYDVLGVRMTIHMDPIELDNEQVNDCRQRVSSIVASLDKRLTIHDFRLVTGKTHTNLIFDVLVPFDCKFTDKQIKAHIDEELTGQDVNYYTVLTFDRDYESP